MLGLVILGAGIRDVFAIEELVRLDVTAPVNVLKIGDSVQITAIGVRIDGIEVNVTKGATGTKYDSADVADNSVEITSDGLVTIHGAHFRSIQARYFIWIIVSHGSTATPFLISVVAADTDKDEIEDDFERQHGLNPNDLSDAKQDFDGDGLSNLAEFNMGTNPTNSDTDGDGVSDGVEVQSGSDPVNPKIRFILNENCAVSVLNRTAQVKPGGAWVLRNVPADFGQVRARATCVVNGVTHGGQSDLFTVPQSGVVTIGDIHFNELMPIPSSLTLSAPTSTLTTAGATAQLTVTAKYPDGSTKNVSAASAGTSYTNSNPKVATVSSNGLVTAVSSGTVIISALNEGALGLIRIQVVLSGGDTDGDGIPDDVERDNGLNPNDPTDGFADFDNDGLTNKQELVDFGTDIHVADTDSDGLSDGDEVQKYGTNPALADTDGDGVSDGVEVANGSDPKDPNSRPKLTSIMISPPNFVLTVNTVIGEASRQVIVTGKRVDGSTVNLTADPGTNYSSSDLNICNFGAEKGRIFAANNGSCTITATNGGLSAQATVAVQTFAPTPLTFVSIPGTTNNVDVSGDFAYVAAGASGLRIVNVSNRSAPILAGSLDTPGNAQDVQVIGNLAYVADGTSGMRIIDVTDPNTPVLRGSIDTPGDAQDIMVKGSRAFVADGASGLQILDVTNPQSPVLLGSVDTPGSASGVDVDAQRNLAVVADGASGIRVIDITDIAHPTIIGSLDTGNATDVAVRDGFAFVADTESSFTTVDLSDPSHPTLGASTPFATGGRLNDVVLAGRFGFGADIFFVNGVPIIDISTPANPIPRAILNFSNFGDDNGTGIAVDSAYVYLTTDRNRLLIGQYLQIEDTAGIRPTVRITSPASGDTVIEGSSLSITVDATDDIAVAAVTLLVNGNAVATDTAPPYQFNFSVPVGVSTLTLSATATDFGDNVGTAENVVVNVIPDPGTTVIGKVVDSNGNPVSGATITTVNNLSSMTDPDGRFSIPGVPTVSGTIFINASATQDGKKLRGRSPAVSPIPGGTTDVGEVKLRGGGRIALVHSDSGSNVKNALVATGLFQNEDVDIIDARFSTPSLSALEGYSAVLVWSNFPFQNPDLLGDTLADYVAQGGGIVFATYVFSQPWRIGGRILGPGLIPFAVSNNRFTTSGTIDLANSNTSHPILASVEALSYFVNSNYTNPTLTEGATLVARDTSGNNLIAVNSTNRIVGISIFPSLGQAGQIFANALDFVR